LVNANLAGTLRKSDTLITNLSTTTAQFHSTAAQLDSVLRKVNQGQGSMAKLMNDSLLYSDVRRLTQSLQGLIDTLKKTPGKIPIQIKIF
jgi:hypothetical protein